MGRTCLNWMSKGAGITKPRIMLIHFSMSWRKSFKKVCKPEEWTRYEPTVLKRLDKAWDGEKLKIFMHRKDFEQAPNLKERSPD